MANKKRQINNNTMENNKNDKNSPTNSRSKPSKRHALKNGTAHSDSEKAGFKFAQDKSYLALVGIAAIICAVIHKNYISNIHENEKHFSHLSSMEREMSFRTEQGLYYSYYKTIVTAPTFWNGFSQIMYDNVTEYPLTINTLKRFNLYPEVVLAAAFRIYKSVTDSMKIKTVQCWQINRGQGLEPVDSCEGMGDPAYFYIEIVFILNGIMLSIFFILGTYLSGTMLGGLITVICYFYNHGECTRIQWTPHLRESFAFPFCILNMLITSAVLRNPRPSYRSSAVIALSVVSFMLPWQFAQFSLLTQILSVFGCYLLRLISAHKMRVIATGFIAGLSISWLLLFGNELLLTGFLASTLFTIFIIVQFESVFRKIGYFIIEMAVQGLCLIIGLISIKSLISKLLAVADDAHIGDILRSKFFNFKNFDTMLYTCAPEFDFMEDETPMRVMKTLLAPSAVIAVTGVIWEVCYREYKEYKKNIHQEKSQPKELRGGNYSCKPNSEFVFHVFLLFAHTVMAILIMRLKLFWTPHLCIVASLLASPRLFRCFGSKHAAVIGILIAGMSIQGYYNIKGQMDIKGEYNNPDLEITLEWIKANTPKNAVFAGSMPTMATVKLVTLRPIVNHPHYEDLALRQRTKKIYSIYSKRSIKQVWETLRGLKVEYFYLEHHWCFSGSKPGCGLSEVWDALEPENIGKSVVCQSIVKKAEPYFHLAFQQDSHYIFKLVDNPKL